jgi:hypothetical protein
MQPGKPHNLQFNLGRSSPPVTSSNYINMQSGTGSLISGTGDLSMKSTGQERKDTRFQNGVIGPPPGIKVQYEGKVERDVYGQPLSPTNMLTNGKGSFEKSTSEANADASKRSQAPKKQEHLQESLKGVPKMAGLSSFEYSTGAETGLKYHCALVKEENIDDKTIQRYTNTFHRDAKDENAENNSGNTSGIIRKNIQIETDKHIFSLGDDVLHSSYNKDPKIAEKGSGVSRDARSMVEVSINLPYQMLVEQIELKMNQQAGKFELLNKYLKVSGATKSSVVNKDAINRESRIGPDIQLTLLNRVPESKYFKLRSGYFDTEKKVIEMNVQGLSN